MKRSRAVERIFNNTPHTYIAPFVVGISTTTHGKMHIAPAYMAGKAGCELTGRNDGRVKQQVQSGALGSLCLHSNCDDIFKMKRLHGRKREKGIWDHRRGRN